MATVNAGQVSQGDASSGERGEGLSVQCWWELQEVREDKLS